MIRIRTLAFLTLLALASPAQALKLIVWDRELQTKLGYGETSGGRMTVQLVQDYSGPVVALFSREEDEKARSLYPSLQSRYDGTLKAGQLTLDVQNTPVTLAKFLSGLKLNLVLQPVGQVFILPGLRSVTDPILNRTDPGGR
ncbi:hypothetical protein E5F05_21010 [Deinococcus metallilatus]|uniref:Uncharacterized protein n=1 Tax=Deinococcus metallilatus TaxID=1211322 RepID=A0AAJ5K5X7_9DEIO|nr:hypothetical protein [Deinococcus metallilatus]MBB5294455.1 hypothetical protein [Deinococcus metallilatus]QBY10200.1 hypothetical protein E5F05_21010 [Deinococcus metallilatus]RXJ13926.1 hypothetical protein ERJ73_04660 [Deinococcus metallilatus]TLK29891.1 hypothetical protein FCS05_04975 [Deinococcus metallilatus]GMA15671.1 hypothetical protein GCM10025871_20020 [Deinococcus metallilatus]